MWGGDLPDDDDSDDGKLVIDEDRQQQDIHQRKKKRGLCDTSTTEQRIHAKTWLRQAGISSSGNNNATLPLDNIYEAYRTYCKETGQEPVTIKTLAEVIRHVFPNPLVCRLGPRGKQRVHYRNLSFGKIEKEITPEDGGGILEVKQNLSTVEFKNPPDMPIDLSIRRVRVLSTVELNGDVTTDNYPPDMPIDLSVRRRRRRRPPPPPPSDYRRRRPPPPPPSDYTSSHTTITRYEDACDREAQNLIRILNFFYSNTHHTKNMLRTIAHNVSCNTVKCSPLCRMFSRLYRHPPHVCSVNNLYTYVLRSHVQACEDSLHCGLPSCPALRARLPW